MFGLCGQAHILLQQQSTCSTIQVIQAQLGSNLRRPRGELCWEPPPPTHHPPLPFTSDQLWLCSVLGFGTTCCCSREENLLPLFRCDGGRMQLKNANVEIVSNIYIYIYIYISSNLHPSPNSRWLHHTALRYVRRAQSGAYMWWKGLNSVKTGSKRAKNTCLSIPNGPGSLLEKHVFDPFLTHFWSQNGPFSRHFGIFHGPKPVATGSKWAKTTWFEHHKWSRIIFEKTRFDPFLTHFKSQNGPFSKYFGIFHGPKRATTGSKRPKTTCLSIPSGLGTTLEKIIFFALGTLVDPPLAPTVPLCVGWPALRLHQVTTGTGVDVSRWAILALGNHKKWGVAGGLGAPGICF